ncbi:MAG: hypothetical protein ABIJ57_12315 [Pseudomonadota bacterium]
MMECRPHLAKVKHFVSVFPFRLTGNEWKDKFPVGETETGRVATYNPDYKCLDLGCYVEVATSKPNISTQGWKWRKAIRDGVPLKVYWWEGKEITNDFRY